jgi:hypothetical protein
MVILKYSIGINNPDVIITALNGKEAIKKVVEDVRCN